MERLVHSPKNLIPSNLAMMKIRITGNWEFHQNAITDSETGGCMWFYMDIATARNALSSDPLFFAAGMNPFAVAVPSVIVPVWNVVRYPHGRGFWEHVLLESVEAFEFDPRLFPDGAAMEPSEGEKAL